MEWRQECIEAHDHLKGQVWLEQMELRQELMEGYVRGWELTEPKLKRTEEICNC